MNGVCAVVGGQYGSEAKGHVVGHLARGYRHHVRVGAANAGHTVVVGGEDHVLQQLPCAAFANPDAKLYIGPGALISAGILERELQALRKWRREQTLSPPHLVIDGRAHVISAEQKKAERSSGLAERIGSTSATAGEGIGVAQADRVMRDPMCMLARDWTWPLDVSVGDVPGRLARAGGILLEGTQGAGLSLTTGEFPYVTSRNTTSAGLCADVGIAPTRLDRVVVVLRTFPIRVAGNSGPFHRDSEEISWGDIGVEPQSELTTVTRKVRRVATFSLEQAVESVALNGGTEIALMFADYLEPSIRDSEGPLTRETLLGLYPVTEKAVHQIEMLTGAPVTMLGTGPATMLDLEPKHEVTPIKPCVSGKAAA